MNEPYFTVEAGKPTWVFDIHVGRGWRRARFPLDGTQPMLVALDPRLKMAYNPKQLRAAKTWVKRHRTRSAELLALPIDWSKPLYARFGKWSGASGTFLREDAEEPSLYPAGSQHERRGEIGVSVLDVDVTGSGWQPRRPSQRHALYKLPHDYLATFAGRELFIVQGDRIEVGEHYDEVGDRMWPVYATGADGEPLLEPSSITVVETAR